MHIRESRENQGDVEVTQILITTGRNEGLQDWGERREGWVCQNKRSQRMDSVEAVGGATRRGSVQGTMCLTFRSLKMRQPLLQNHGRSYARADTRAVEAPVKKTPKSIWATGSRGSCFDEGHYKPMWKGASGSFIWLLTVLSDFHGQT